MSEKTATQERSERNQQDIANLVKKVDALADKVDDINSKFDRWTGAVKALGWLGGVGYAVFNIAKGVGLFEMVG